MGIRSNFWFLVGQGALAKSELLRGLIRFGLAGGVSTLTYFVLTVVMVHGLSFRPIHASVLAYCIALVVSWFLQSRYVFRKNGDSKAIIRFIVLGLLGLIISVVVFLLGEDRFIGHAWILALFVSILIPVLNFLVMNFWVFVNPKLQRDG